MHCISTCNALLPLFLPLFINNLLLMNNTLAQCAWFLDKKICLDKCEVSNRLKVSPLIPVGGQMVQCACCKMNMSITHVHHTHVHHEHVPCHSSHTCAVAHQAIMTHGCNMNQIDDLVEFTNF